MKAELILTNARIYPMTDGADAVIESGSIAIESGRICWIGASKEAEKYVSSEHRVSLDGRCVTPGLIDCHTHIIHAGRRTREFVQRLEGVSYEEIARRGGGIASTVRATRNADLATLITLGERRIRHAFSCGTTTMEIKSGYGLDLETERKMLVVARELQASTGMGIHATYLALHALPREYLSRSNEYVSLVVKEFLPSLISDGLVDSVDAFCEKIAFSAEQVSHLFKAVTELALPVRLHADQLTDSDGAKLAASFRALSADHLEYTNSRGVAALAEAGTVAVLLPGAFHYLRESQYPPINELRAAGVPIAVATDWNPGSSPVSSLPVAMNLACLLLGLTPSEALEGVTRHAARALGLSRECGTLSLGKRADLAVWDVEEPAEIVERLGDQVLHSTWIRGRAVWQRSAAWADTQAGLDRLR